MPGAFYLSAVLAVAMAGGDLQDDGLKALDRQDYPQAAEIFTKLTVADSKDYSAFFNLALAEIGLKQDAKAAEHFKQTLALKPGLFEAELNLGILQLRTKNAADALPLLRDAAKQKPAQARPQRYLGDALLETNDLSSAAEAYRAALAIDPKLAGAELGLARALLRQKQLGEAAPHYRQAAALDANLKSYQLELASALLAAGENQQAVAFLKLFPDDPGACEQLGNVYLEQQQPAQAVEALQAAVKLAPTVANQMVLATALIRNKQDDLAKTTLSRVLQANPNDYDVRMAVGRVYRDKHEYLVAANQFLAAAKLRPDSVEAWNESAAVLVLSEQYSEALAALDKVHNLNADIPGDYYFRAIVLDKLRQVKPALASYRRFLETSQGKNPDQEFIARQRARILEKEANR